MNGLVRIGLALAQVPDVMVAEIDKELPTAARLIALAKQADPLIKQLMPLADQAAPIIEQLLPILKSAYPDIAEMLPLAEKVVAFVEGKKVS